MVQDYLKIKIIVEDSPLRDYIVDELSVTSLKGSYSGDLPPQNTTCHVLVTRIINGSYVTLELIGKLTGSDEHNFLIEFTDISSNTVNQINNIMLPRNLSH